MDHRPANDTAQRPSGAAHSIIDTLQAHRPFSRAQDSTRCTERRRTSTHRYRPGLICNDSPTASRPPQRIVVTRLAAGQPLHQTPQARNFLARRQQQMHVVGHQAIRVYPDTKGQLEFSKRPGNADNRAVLQKRAADYVRAAPRDADDSAA